jgi:hypothetical protein
MKFKLGDRVVIKHSVTRNITGGKEGLITSVGDNGSLLGVTLVDATTQFKSGRIYFSASELEFDKRHVINEILKEI